MKKLYTFIIALLLGYNYTTGQDLCSNTIGITNGVQEIFDWSTYNTPNIYTLGPGPCVGVNGFGVAHFSVPIPASIDCPNIAIELATTGGDPTTTYAVYWAFGNDFCEELIIDELCFGGGGSLADIGYVPSGATSGVNYPDITTFYVLVEPHDPSVEFPLIGLTVTITDEGTPPSYDDCASPLALNVNYPNEDPQGSANTGNTFNGATNTSAPASFSANTMTNLCASQGSGEIFYEDSDADGFVDTWQDFFDGTPSGISVENTVWACFTPETDGFYEINVDNIVNCENNSGIQWILTTVRDCSSTVAGVNNTAAGTLDFSSNGSTAGTSLFFALEAGNEVCFVADGFAGDACDFDVRVTQQCPTWTQVPTQSDVSYNAVDCSLEVANFWSVDYGTIPASGNYVTNSTSSPFGSSAEAGTAYDDNDWFPIACNADGSNQPGLTQLYYSTTANFDPPPFGSGGTLMNLVGVDAVTCAATYDFDVNNTCDLQYVFIQGVTSPDYPGCQLTTEEIMVAVQPELTADKFDFTLDETTCQLTATFVNCNGESPSEGLFIDANANGTRDAGESNVYQIPIGDGGCGDEVTFTFVLDDPMDAYNGDVSCITYTIDVEVPACGCQVETNGFIVPTTICSEGAVDFTADNCVPNGVDHTDFDFDLYIYDGGDSQAPVGYEPFDNITAGTVAAGNSDFPHTDPNMDYVASTFDAGGGCGNLQDAVGPRNITCAPRMVTYYVFVWDRRLDTDDDASCGEYSDPRDGESTDCMWYRYDVEILPEPPTAEVISDAAGCGIGPLPTLQLVCADGTVLDSQAATCTNGGCSGAVTTYSCSAASRTWTIAEIETFLGVPAGSSCYTDETANYAGSTAPCPCALLPIVIADIDAMAMEDYNKVVWSTASEVNNKFQIVERSQNGYSDWEEVEVIEGQEASQTLRQYEVEDFKPTLMSYYRIKSIDFDGQTEFSEIVSVDRYKLNNTRGLRVSPNPANDELNIFVPQDIEYGKLIVFDYSGKEVRRENYSDISNVIELNISDLNSGLYIITLQTNAGLKTAKMIKH